MITSVVLVLVTAVSLAVAFRLRKPQEQDPVRTTREAALGREALGRVLARVPGRTPGRLG